MIRNLLKTSLVCAACIICHGAFAQQIIYVNKAATGSANGTSWSNAYTNLQIALNAAALLPGSKQIWVAQGEYKPADNLDRTKSFVIPNNTIVYGGFSGGEPNVWSRDWPKNRTVLSGDLGRQFDYADNSHHVIVLKDVDQSSGID